MALRSHPFYYFLIARTKYYDEAFLAAIRTKVRHIFIIGSGTDTRPYRFIEDLKRNKINLLECDQPKAIQIKQEIARRHWPADFISYLPLDLNDETWPQFAAWLANNITGQTFVLMEGVSPYINEKAFGHFLDFLAINLPAGSRVAYDFKLLGVNDAFGRENLTDRPFRLSYDRKEIMKYHEERQYKLEHLELSHELEARFMTHPDNPTIQLFREDVLIQLEVVSRQKIVGETI
jgi:methyltransferase (TIGR00027 family)